MSLCGREDASARVRGVPPSTVDAPDDRAPQARRLFGCMLFWYLKVCYSCLREKKQEEKRMNGKIGMRALSVLLAVMLVGVMMAMAMAMPIVPAASTEEQTRTNPLLQNQETEKNIYTMLGIEQPSRDEGPQWQRYNEARGRVDDLIRGSESRESIREIIGYLEGQRERVVLYYGMDGNIYGLLDSQGKVSKSRVDPVVIGSKTEYFEDSCKDCSVGNQSSNYSVSYELSRIDLSALGSEEFGARSIYDAQVTRTDSWIYLSITRATLYTKGTFTYDYGNRILGISDNTYTSQGINFDRCEFGHSVRETGYTGYVESNVIWAYLTLSPPKHSVDAWISCDIYGSTDGSSSTSDWVSIGVGCQSVP